VLLKLSKWLLILTLSVSIGLHWAALQSAAWMGMIIKYSQDSTFSEAIEKTFDGQHPCKLCKLVDAGKKAEKKSESKDSLKKLDLVSPNFALFTFHSDSGPKVSFLLHCDLRIETPPTPPPLAA
jgi:hypothetical protein